MNSYLIERNYDLKVSDMRLLDKHFGTEIYVVEADTKEVPLPKRYIVKVLPLYFENIDNEGFVADYLYNHGHKVARLLKSRDGSYVIRAPEFQFTVQEYIEGSTLPINTAPEWLLEQSADFLGKTTMTLKDYIPLPLRFGKDFFTAETAITFLLRSMISKQCRMFSTSGIASVIIAPTNLHLLRKITSPSQC